MKIKTILTAFGVLALLSLAACQSDDSKPLEAKDLLHHNFVLVSIDDKPFSGDKAPSIEFNENFHVSGAICNRYVGKGELQNNTLTVPNMASTKMICNDKVLDELEVSMGRMMVTGAKVTFKDNTLTLEDDKQKLTFVLKDAVN